MNHDTPEAIAITEKAAKELLVREKLLDSAKWCVALCIEMNLTSTNAYASACEAIKEAEAL